ncbi:hypothetical protein [Nostoc sp.]
MTQHTLEEYFQLHADIAVDFQLRAQNRDGGWLFYIHPQNVNGETWDFHVRGNQLTCIVSSSQPTEDQEKLLMIIEQINSKVNELIQSNHRMNRDLDARLKVVEEFQRNFESWQAELRDRGE